MIRINLLGEKIDNSASHVLQGLGFILILASVISGLTVFHGSQQDKLKQMESDRDRLKAQLVKLQNETKEVENIEAKKKELQDMLRTIAELKARKNGPAHLLDEVSKYIPQRAWLTSVQQRADSLELAGYAIDYQTISDYSIELRKSPYFIDDKVQINQAKMEELVKDDKPSKLVNYSLVAKIENFLTLHSSQSQTMGLVPNVNLTVGVVKDGN